MDIDKIIRSLDGCACGKKHTVDNITVKIATGLIQYAGDILIKAGFPKHILIVADQNTISASDGLLDNLNSTGFNSILKLYDDMRTADMEQVEEIIEILHQNPDIKGVLSVGTGSLNDICRYAAYLHGVDFSIFATAPSMDGFAASTAPITENGFKATRQAKQPTVIIADTNILAAAPHELKAAGFGDMIAKYVALVDWKISCLLTGEHYCSNIAAMTQKALDTMVSLANRVSKCDVETAAVIMEALIFTGLAMKLADSVRPASGTEHIISHFWEVKKLEEGIISDYHGKKVGVASLMAVKLYKEIANRKSITPHREIIDWDTLRNVYGDILFDEVVKLNTPPVTDKTTPQRISECWDEICRIVKTELPSVDELTEVMKAAGAATTLEEISVSPELGAKGLKYHPYMRHRMTLARIIPMIE